MTYGPEPKKDGQHENQCLAQHDHEAHDWYGMPERWCPGLIAPVMEDRPLPAWASTEAWEQHDAPTEKQCLRQTAHGSHDWTNWDGDEELLHCPGVGAHHNTQIGKGGPHDPDRHAYRDNYELCLSRGPRVGEDVAYCKQPKGHGPNLAHKSAISDGLGDVRW